MVYRAANLLSTIKNFIVDVLYQRDRYLSEFGSSVVTFGIGVIASVSQSDLGNRPALTVFREIPIPEIWVMVAAFPGLFVALKNLVGPKEYRTPSTFVVMSSFYVLSSVSYILDWPNLQYWTLLSLLVGTMQGYAIVRHLTDLRWAVAMVGSFFWIAFSLSYTVSSPQLALALSPIYGWVLMNVLSMRRLAARIT